MYPFELEFNLDICLGVGLYCNAILFVLESSVMFSIVAAKLYTPTKSLEGFLFLYTLPSIYYGSLLNDGHSDWSMTLSYFRSLFLYMFFYHIGPSDDLLYGNSYHHMLNIYNDFPYYHATIYENRFV